MKEITLCYEQNLESLFALLKSKQVKLASFRFCGDKLKISSKTQIKEAGSETLHNKKDR